MHVNRLGFSLLLLLLASALAPVRSQSCDNPLTLCPEDPASVFITEPRFFNFDCIDADYMAVLKFRSNHDFETPGNARISITQVNCSSVSGPDSISAVVVAAAGDPCDPAGLTAMGPCVSGVDDLIWETSVLDHDSEYFLLIGTNHNPADSLCALYVELLGSGVTLNVCCNHIMVAGESAELEVTGGDPVYGYAWTPEYYLSDPDMATTTVTPATDQNYQVDGVIGECQVSGSVSVKVGCAVSPPNTFTPNGDGLNDLWGIDGISAYPGVQVEVFNRWGQLVHRSLGYAQPWDGTGRSGKPLTPGTYYYLLELNDGKPQSESCKTGYVTIIR